MTGLWIALLHPSMPVVGNDFEDRYQRARVAIAGAGESGVPAVALEEMRALAESGFAKAQGYWGYLLAGGIGVERDGAAARLWLARAAEQELGSAQLNLGLMLLVGKGGEPDLASGITWIQRAAEGGEVAAQAKLAEFAYFGHEALPQDPAVAARWARQAAEQGDAWSQNLYGTLLESGRLGAVDRAAAMEWYRKAAEQGNAKAQTSLGRLLESGLVGKRDMVEAYYWLWKAVEQEEPAAINLLKELVPGMTPEERQAALERIGKE